MKNSAIIILLFTLVGCASTQNVANSIPDAIGTIAGAAVFGGEVSMDPLLSTLKKMLTGKDASFMVMQGEIHKEV